MEAPCKNCEMQGCGAYHSQCERYQNFVLENERRKETKKETSRKRVEENATN